MFIVELCYFLTKSYIVLELSHHITWKHGGMCV